MVEWPRTSWMVTGKKIIGYFKCALKTSNMTWKMKVLNMNIESWEDATANCNRWHSLEKIGLRPQLIGGKKSRRLALQ